MPLSIDRFYKDIAFSSFEGNDNSIKNTEKKICYLSLYVITILFYFSMLYLAKEYII